MRIFAFHPLSTNSIWLIIIFITLANYSYAFSNHNNIRPLSIIERTSHASFANRLGPPSMIRKRLGDVSAAGGNESDRGKDDFDVTYHKKRSKTGKMKYFHMPDRRQLLLSSALSVSSLLMSPSRPASARGLVQFPVDNPDNLLNTYHFLRVGTSLLEEEGDIWTTNPLFL